MFANPTIVERMQNVGRISLLQNTPYTENLKYLKMTIVARAHNPPVGSRIKPNRTVLQVLGQTNCLQRRFGNSHSTPHQVPTPSKT